MSTVTKLLHVTMRFGVGLLVLNHRAGLAGDSAGPNLEKKPADEIQDNRWSGELGVNFVAAYYAFGILQENKGAIAQPFLNLSCSLFESDGFINEATIGVQLWSSIHSRKTGAAADSVVPAWYEFDYYVPIGITFAKNATLMVGYFEYDFPNGSFTTQRSVNATLGYDDTVLLGKFALNPHVTVLYNFDGVLGIERSNAWYAELGIGPGFTVGQGSAYATTVRFPLAVGFGDNHFYPEDSYGFFSAGVNVSVPLAFMSKSPGTWTVNAGLTYLNLGEATAAINAEGSHSAFVGQLGFSITF